MVRVPVIPHIARQISSKNIQIKKTVMMMKETSPLQISVYSIIVCNAISNVAKSCGCRKMVMCLYLYTCIIIKLLLNFKETLKNY